MVKKVKASQEEKTAVVKRPDTMLIATEREMAVDLSTKIYEKFDRMIKSIVYFGSSAKRTSTPDSDIDLVIIIDDVSVKWDEELVAWYREELGKIIQNNPYIKSMHVNSVKLSTWWNDLLRGDPVILNVLRYGESLIDFGGFFTPLKVLLHEGKIRSTPEAIYTLLQRAPLHMSRARNAMLGVIDGLYWTMVDSAHAALISANVMPASPELVGEVLTETFVKQKKLNKKYVEYYDETYRLAKSVVHGTITHLEGKQLDEQFKKTDEFLGEMARITKELTESHMNI